MPSYGGTVAEAVAALAAECSLVAEAVRPLPEASFGLATRCPPWDVKALLAHLWRGVDRIPTYLAEPEPADAADCDAVRYWRAYDPTIDARVADRSMAFASRFATGTDLARSFDEHWRACVEAGRRAEPSRVIRTPIATIRLDEYLGTRVVEATIHGMDLFAALGRRPAPTPGGAAIVASILDRLLGTARPTALRDDVVFLEVASGRRAVPPAAIADLGPSFARLPLLR